jgi:hypothetical protein
VVNLTFFKFLMNVFETYFLFLDNIQSIQSNNEPNEIKNATHNTFAKQTWIFSASVSRFALQMYCWLHFQFHRFHHRSRHSLYSVKKLFVLNQ